MNITFPCYSQSRVDCEIKLNHTTLSEWSPKTREILTTGNMSSASLLDALSQHPFLQECYSKYAQEGFSVRQHSQRVLELAQKYRTSLQKDVTNLVSWEEFLLFLALHDIGKGLAQENESLAFGTKLSFKKAELETTQQILTKVMESLGIPTQTICLFCEMLRYDAQGLYLVGDIQLEEAFDNVLEMAKNCHQDPRDFYRIFKTYHLIDAASYPSLEQFFEFSSTTLRYCSFYVELDEALYQSFEQTEQGKKFFENCVQRVHRNEDPNVLHHDFLAHLPHLLKFLEKTHKEMLAYPQQQETYRQVKKGFRDILLYFAKSSQNLENLQTLYANFLASALGRRKLDQPANYSLDFFLDNAPEIKGFIDLKDKLIHFRKDYLCRYSLNKVENFIRKEILVRGIKDHVDLGSSALSLLTTTYLHGTNATILPTLLKTGMNLMPFERLKQEQITPLHEGSAARNNQYKIPGTSLDHAMEVYSYAAQAHFAPIQSKEEQEIIKFLNTVQECPNFSGKDPSEEWVRLSKAILRLRAFDPDLYQTYQSKLSQAIQKIEVTPKTDRAIQSLKMAIDENKLVPRGIAEALRHPYGMVLASTTLHTATSNVHLPSDRCAQKASLLGKDMQIIFTGKKDEARLKTFLEEEGLNKKVSLIDLDCLLNAIVLNQLASPYFADIASKKKLVRVTPETPRKIHPPQIAPSTAPRANSSIYSYLRESVISAIFGTRIPE